MKRFDSEFRGYVDRVKGWAGMGVLPLGRLRMGLRKGGGKGGVGGLLDGVGKYFDGSRERIRKRIKEVKRFLGVGDEGLIRRIFRHRRKGGRKGVRDGVKKARSIKVGKSMSGEQLGRVLHARDVDGMTEVNGIPLWKLVTGGR